LNQPFHRLPEDVTVPLSEMRDVMEILEDALDALYQVHNLEPQADALDSAIGRMVRWIWPLLRELDEEGGYDE
jgi:hypothetical protein